VSLRDFRGDKEPEPEAVPARPRLAAKEGLEQARKNFFGYLLSAVRHGKQEEVAIGPRLEADRLVAAAVGGCV
jgi:hypothetical protein